MSKTTTYTRIHWGQILVSELNKNPDITMKLKFGLGETYSRATDIKVMSVSHAFLPTNTNMVTFVIVLEITEPL